MKNGLSTAVALVTAYMARDRAAVEDIINDVDDLQTFSLTLASLCEGALCLGAHTNAHTTVYDADLLLHKLAVVVAHIEAGTAP